LASIKIEFFLEDEKENFIKQNRSKRRRKKKEKKNVLQSFFSVAVVVGREMRENRCWTAERSRKSGKVVVAKFH
jgi:hypothetical protein